EARELLSDRRVLAKRLGLVHGQATGLRRLLQRIRPAPLGIRGSVDADHVLSPLQQRFQHALAERLLSVNHDAHDRPSSGGQYYPAAGAGQSALLPDGARALGTRVRDDVIAKIRAARDPVDAVSTASYG